MNKTDLLNDKNIQNNRRQAVLMFFKPTKVLRFKFEIVDHGFIDLIEVEIEENRNKPKRWRMKVNGKPSRIVTYYGDILNWGGYVLVTEYWQCTFTPWVPFLARYMRIVEEEQPLENTENRTKEIQPELKDFMNPSIKKPRPPSVIPTRDTSNLTMLSKISTRTKIKRKGRIYIVRQHEEYQRTKVFDVVTMLWVYLNSCEEVEIID